jgi:hypothetical protein
MSTSPGRLCFSITGKQEAIVAWILAQCQRRESRKREKTKTRKREDSHELKAVKAFEYIFFVKLKSYLKATGRHVGLLMNFNSAPLTAKRVVAWRSFGFS